MNPEIPKPVIWSTANDIKNHTWYDWFAARFYFVQPLHHYTGTIHITPLGSVVLDGKKDDTQQSIKIIIKKDDILSCVVGFDETFKRRYDRDFGLTFQPLILTTCVDGIMETYYLAIELDYLVRFTNNADWCQAINLR